MSGDEIDEAVNEFQFAAWENLPSTLTVSELSVVLRLDEDTIYKALAAGGLPGRRVQNQWRISRDGLIRMWSSSE